MKIDQGNLTSVYEYVKGQANKSFRNDLLEKSLEYIQLCCMIAYNINSIYTDPDLEDLLHDVAHKIVSPPLEANTPVSDRFVLIDTNGSDNHGLTQQYLKAFIAADVEFAYVYEELDLDAIGLILVELRAYPKATLFTFKEKLACGAKIRAIYSFVRQYNPSKYFMHIMPWDVVAVGVSSQLKGIDRYNINATDHAFWLGASLIDYSIEFRNYGYTVSLEKRGLGKEQLLMLPYYPPINRTEFKGFPESIKDGDVKIFSGGSIYKICGENGAYFKMVKRLLSENKNAQLLFAGTGKNEYIARFIKENNLSQRIHFIGNRTDILEVFENCDLYLGTYPITGGLMSQFAAYAAKPILAYANKDLGISFVEGFVCHLKEKMITFKDYDGFFEYGKRLCSDNSYRESEGKDLQKCLITEEIFNDEFIFMIRNDKTKRVGQLEEVDYLKFSNLYLEVENDFGQGIQKLVAYKLRLKTVLFPKIFLNATFIGIKQIIDKLKNSR